MRHNFWRILIGPVKLRGAFWLATKLRGVQSMGKIKCTAQFGRVRKRHSKLSRKKRCLIYFLGRNEKKNLYVHDNSGRWPNADFLVAFFFFFFHSINSPNQFAWAKKKALWKKKNKKQKKNIGFLLLTVESLSDCI